MNRDLVKGMAIGAGAALLAPVLLPALARITRPAMGAAMRAGTSAWERGREAFAEFSEYAEDLAAETRARQGPAVPAAEAAVSENPSNGQGAA